MVDYYLPNGSVNTLASMFRYSHQMSENLLGNFILVSVFLIILFWNINVDGFKKRAVYSFLMTTVLGLFLLYMNVVTGFIFGIFVTGSVLTVLWVGFTGT